MQIVNNIFLMSKILLPKRLTNTVDKKTWWTQLSWSGWLPLRCSVGSILLRRIAPQTDSRLWNFEFRGFIYIFRLVLKNQMSSNVWRITASKLCHTLSKYLIWFCFWPFSTNTDFLGSEDMATHQGEEGMKLKLLLKFTSCSNGLVGFG